MPKLRVTADFIAAAIAGYEFQKDQIESKIAELQAILSGGRRIVAGGKLETPKRKRRLSAAARKRIADAQKKRWAAYRKRSKQALEPVKKKPTTKKSRSQKGGGQKGCGQKSSCQGNKEGCCKPGGEEDDEASRQESCEKGGDASCLARSRAKDDGRRTTAA